MFSHVHKKFHPMEGKCYALVWGVMHFCQYLYYNHFTLKITILFTTPEYSQDCDKQLPSILFEYKCGVQTSTKFSPHMVLTRWTPKLKVDNFLSPLVHVFEANDDPIVMVEQMINKL
jgi:hypothetical protein